MNNTQRKIDVKSLRFGETIIEGIYSSSDNPHNRGVYVRTIRRTGRINPGVWIEVTDRNGEFWQWPIDAVRVVINNA